MKKWITLITSLPTENAALRQRTWRALKASGAAVLRDGVYLTPESCHATLESLATDVNSGGGTAHVLRVEEPDGAGFVALFDRSHEFAALLGEISQTREVLSAETVQEVLRKVRKLRKLFTTLIAIDFFPGESQRQVDRALCEVELACARTLSPDEPQVIAGAVSHCQISDYQGRIWATRQRPWVDRLASAWLILRFIDPHARFLWIETPADCPTEAISFDFDTATFTHVGSLVTFEVLMASFGLKQPALARLGLLVHFLDIGGVQPPEAVGIESVLAGMREGIADDDQLLTAASSIFDGLLTSFDKGMSTT